MTPTDGRENALAKSEATVLSETSVLSLSRELAKTPNASIVFLMYLNIPTSAIVSAAAKVSEVGLKGADTETITKFTKDMLAYWKVMKGAAKDKDKVNDLQRALREMGNVDMADIIKEKYAANSEISADDFPAAN